MADQQSPSAGEQWEGPHGETAPDDETIVFDAAQLQSRRRRLRSARWRIYAGSASVVALAGAGIFAFGGGGPDNLAALMGSTGHGAGAPDTVPSTTPSTAEDQARAETQASPHGSPKGSTPGSVSPSDPFRSAQSSPGADGQRSPSTGTDPSASHSTSTTSHPTSPSPSHSDSHSGEITPSWQSHHYYVVGNRVVYGGVAYTCIQAHTSVDNPDWFRPEAHLWKPTG
ncbi:MULTISPECIES: carbohydrate-binding protein [unclassified Streptomyces]|uniref:carbohydrate-binding protein n=1 Tax=unclassified Streptomyces TaxID=2593676 RepID=UPI00382C27DB